MFRFLGKPTHYVVDSEYNVPTQELISLAIVPLYPRRKPTALDGLIKTQGAWCQVQEDPAHEFYEVLDVAEETLDPWVVENVMPRLDKAPIPKADFQARLEAFLIERGVEHLHYDWCDDIAYLNRALVTGPGERIKFPLQFLSHTHHVDLAGESEVPHNALHDARAISAALRQRIMNAVSDL